METCASPVETVIFNMCQPIHHFWRNLVYAYYHHGCIRFQIRIRPLFKNLNSFCEYETYTYRTESAFITFRLHSIQTGEITQLIPSVIRGVRVTRSLVCFADWCLSFCTFSVAHCIVCPLIYRFWLPLWYLQTLVHTVRFFVIYNDLHKIYEIVWFHFLMRKY